MVCSQQTLVYFRVIAAVFLTGNVAWAVSGLFPAWGDQAISIGHPRYVYLTNLSSILDMLFFLCAAPVTFLQWRHPKKSPAPTGVQRVIHMLYELALTVSTLVMLMFWTAVFPKSSKFLKKHGLEMTPGMWYKNIADHLIFTVLMGLDFAFSGATMYPPHFLFIVISVLVYACVNCISRFLHGTAVYPDINFENAYTYVLLGASLALLLFLYYIFYTVGLSKPTPKSIADNEAQQRDPEPADIEQRTPGAEQA